MEKVFKKLQLRKEVVAKLTKNEMKLVVGGENLSNIMTCASDCHSSSQPCKIAYPGYVYTTQPYAFSGLQQTCGLNESQCGSDENQSCNPPC